MTSAVLAGLLAFAALAVAAGLFYLFRVRLQLCPHCSWVVKRVQHGWARCPRCHKQYARRTKLRPH